MAAAAAVRQAERDRVRAEQERRENARYYQELAEQCRADFEAGPPGGCYDCYTWGPDWFTPRYRWWHITIDVGDCTCYHSCHAEPVPCAPVVLG